MNNGSTLTLASLVVALVFATVAQAEDGARELGRAQAPCRCHYGKVAFKGAANRGECDTEAVGLVHCFGQISCHFSQPTLGWSASPGDSCKAELDLPFQATFMAHSKGSCKSWDESKLRAFCAEREQRFIEFCEWRSCQR